MFKRSLVVALLGMSITASAVAAPQLIPDPAHGALSGFPGDVVGWGYSLTNDADYLVLDSADFVTPANIGTFTDFSPANFLVLGPGIGFSQAFNAATQEGLGSFAINADAPVGYTALGELYLTYSLYAVDPYDPNFDPFTDLISTGNPLTARASVIVLAPSAVPEPSTFLLLGAGLGGLVVWRRRRADVRL